jgi:hypothetical protein
MQNFRVAMLDVDGLDYHRVVESESVAHAKAVAESSYPGFKAIIAEPYEPDEEIIWYTWLSEEPEWND